MRLISSGCAGLLAVIAAAGAEGDIAAAKDTDLGQLWEMQMFDETKSLLSPFVEPFLMYHQVCICRWTCKLAAVCDVHLASHLHACIPYGEMSANSCQCSGTCALS